MPRRPSIDALLASYPRTRPALPPVQRARYEQEYMLNRTGGTWINRLALSAESWMHRQVAKDGMDHGGAILELGAGTLNHLPYEPASAAYDIIEPFTHLFAHSPERGRVRSAFDDIGLVPEECRYRRILSIAVLEHLTDLPRTVARCALHLDADGMFQAAIPSEGGALWGVSWRLTTGLAYRLRNHADYGAVMRHEHLNSQIEVLAVVRACFHDVAVRRFPPFGRHGSLYSCILARRPDADFATSLLR